ncbi:cytochrome c biogenesis CcdA family protein [Nocardia sp. CDC153]|uniref:cytochrome c biogenesis CcdA family protein n=1 Tax=Nocardia sp. CDC153 TaxID=3112167 RepID=UPI002DBC0CE1|nr:cytochrome c biogenesis CcdA family protein [Nocardia sp. CDC153]MEC3951557.1 cytochrome c biogenesis CcdA family protein [Nocardia sp. CDC153]
MTGGIGFFAAFLGGLLALLSPCSALLLPSFFAYSFESQGKLLARTGVFYLGLCTTLVPLGAAGSLAGRLLVGHRELLIAIGGWTIIVLGVVQILGRGFAFGFAQRAAATQGRPEQAGAVYLLGLVYGLAGFCAGPILGSILAVAAVGGSPIRGGLLLAVYALGLAAPLFVLASLWDRFELGRRKWLRGRTFHLGRVELHTTSVLSGLFFIALGALFLVFDGTAALPGILSADTEFALENQARRLGDLVSNTTVLLILAAIALAVVAWRLLGGERSDVRGSRRSPSGES